MKRFTADSNGAGYTGITKTVYVGATITDGLAGAVGRHIEVTISPTNMASLLNLMVEYSPEALAAAINRAYPGRDWQQPADRERHALLRSFADSISPEATDAG